MKNRGIPLQKIYPHRATISLCLWECICRYGNKTKEWGLEVEYASAVTEIDNQFGIVMAALDEAGLTNETVVFFASDNGASNEGGKLFPTSCMFLVNVFPYNAT